MAAGDPYPTGDEAVLRVPPAFAAAFLTGQITSPPKDRKVFRMVLRDPDTGEEVDLGGWQITAVATRRQDAGYDVARAQLRAVFD